MMQTPLDRQALQPRDTIETPYLKLQLTPELPAVLTMNYTQEALIVPAAQLTLVPNMPIYMLGLLNRRGRIYWVIDLPAMLGLSSPMTTVRDYHIVLIRVNNKPLGCAVPKIQEVLRLTAEVMPLAKNSFPEKIWPFVRGGSTSGSDRLLVLEPKTIVDAAASPTVFSSSADFAIHL